MTDSGFRELIVESIAALERPGASIEDVLDPFEPPRSTEAARALGFLEGAAAALNVTVLELLWEFGLRTDRKSRRKQAGRGS